MHNNKHLREAAKHGWIVWAKSEVAKESLMATAKKIGVAVEIRVATGILKRVQSDAEARHADNM